MTRIKKIGIGAVALIAVLAGLAYYYVIDGGLPSDPEFDFQIEELRRLAQADQVDLPHAIEVVSFASREVPSFAVEAGLFEDDVTMSRTAFRLRSDWGDILVDVGMDEAIWQEFSPEDTFNAEGFAQVHKAMATARRIVVTHEHPDHMGYLARYDNLNSLSDVLFLTQEQIEGSAKYARDGKVPTALKQLTPLSSTELSIIAPGVIALPTPGHTPGSVVLFVQMQDGSEVLLLGDLVWNMSNLRNARGRSRLLQHVLMPEPEEREPVYDQLAALIQLQADEPDILMVPSHDDEWITGLIESGQLKQGFAVATGAAN
ncbi:MAG: MBL fold metallo-hydrolase [Erythrobacter sp.]